MSDRDDLWRLLATITVRKAIDTMRHQTRQKRGGGHVLGESALLVGDDAREGVAEILGREPTPEDAARFADDYNRFLDRLKDPALRTDRPAAARRPFHPGDRPGAERVDQDDRSEAPAHPRHLEPGQPRMSRTVPSQESPR